MKSATTILAASFLVGCASPSKVVTADVRIMAGTNEVLTISQPKDTTLSKAVYRKPDGTEIIIEGYQSTANAAAIEATKAQIASQERIATGALDTMRMFLEKGAAGAASAYGIPTPKEVEQDQE